MLKILIRLLKLLKTISKKDKTIVVVSALGGVTDLLLNAASLSEKGNEAYKEKLNEFEQRHLEAVKQLIPVAQQSQLLSLVKKAVTNWKIFAMVFFYYEN